MAREPGRTRLLWAILSLVLPVTFGHTTACRSPALLCRDRFRHELFRLLFCRLTPFPLVLGCSRSLFGVDNESSDMVQEKRHSLFSLALNAARAPHQFYEHHALRQSRVLHARHKSREQDPPPAHNRLDAIPSHLDKRVQIRNRVVGAIVASPTDAVSQEPEVSSAQRVVVARARSPRDAAVHHYLDYLGSMRVSLIP